MTKSQKTHTDIMAERLAALSEDIKPKVGKQAREHAEGIASGYIRKEKGRLEAELMAWAVEGLTLALPKSDAAVWRKYNDAVDAIFDMAKRVGPKDNEYSNLAGRNGHKRISFAQFYTGKDYHTEDAMRQAVQAVPGYKQKRAKLDKRLAELDAIMDATKKAIWRTYKQPSAPTVSGADIGSTIADIMKQAIGVPALAAPAVEADAIDTVEV